MKLLKRIVLVLSVLIVIVVVVIGVLYWRTGSRLSATYSVQPRTVVIPSDSASLALGKHWSDIHCAGCHGDDFSGKKFFEDPSLGHIYSPNLTAGKGGIGGTYRDADWIRAIAHGVRPNGQPLLVMPSGDFHNLSDQDLGSIIAYLKSLPPIDHAIGGYDLKFMTRILVALGAFGDVLAAEIIDHESRPSAPPIGLTARYGEYLVKTSGCRTCHGQELAGGKDPNPAAPPGLNLTPGGNPGKWDADQFIKAMRMGITPEGKPLQAIFMPWPYFGKMTDEELKSIFLYLKSLPKKESAV